MDINIDNDVCIRCGACLSIAPNYLKQDNETGGPIVIKEKVDDNDKSILMAKDCCPTGAIIVSKSN